MSCAQILKQAQNLCSVIQPCKTCIYRKFHFSPVFMKSGVKRKTQEQALEEMKEAATKEKKVQYKKKKSIPVYPNMSIADLAKTAGRSKADVLEALKYTDYNLDSDRIQDIQTVQKVVRLLGFASKTIVPPKKEVENDSDISPQPPPDPSVLIRRPPVVTIMGHVDHGKTTLLDSFRKSNIVSQEFGGITQHIGAFSVTMASGETITFLDTPGHAAFSAMRARGASVTDIIILVVAADDGIMPQTIESIEHAKEANVPIIVAINKIDRPGAAIEKVEQMLLQYSLISEKSGGDVQCIPISALKGTNLQNLQEAVITQTELMDLKGDPVGLVEGHVIESRTVQGRGKAATVIVQRGTLKIGDYLLAGKAWAKVRSMYTEQGTSIKEATLSMPVEVFGWRDLPSAGDQVLQVKSEKKLKEVLQYRENLIKKEQMEKDAEVIKEKRRKHQEEYAEDKHVKHVLGYHTYRYNKFLLYSKKEKEEVHHEGPSLHIIIKGDVDGSVEAILGTLETYQSHLCRLSLIHHGLGEVTLNDVEMAKLFNGEIFAFNVAVSDTVRDLAKQKGVVIHEDNVIYKLFDNLVESLNKVLPDIKEEEVLGEADVREIFFYKSNKQRLTIAGCHCVSGVLQKQQKFKLIRDGQEIYKGQLKDLKFEKSDVSVIKKDCDCGITLQDSSIEIKRGDTIVCFKTNTLKQSIDWTPGFL